MYQHQCWVRFPCKHSLQAGSREEGGHGEYSLNISLQNFAKKKAVKLFKKRNTDLRKHVNKRPDLPLPRIKPRQKRPPREEEHKRAVRTISSTPHDLDNQGEGTTHPAPPSPQNRDAVHSQACRHGDDDLIPHFVGLSCNYAYKRRCCERGCRWVTSQRAEGFRVDVIQFSVTMSHTKPGIRS